MRRRAFLAVAVGISGSSLSGCTGGVPTGPASGLNTERDSSEAAELIEEATDDLTTAAAEFEYATSRLGGLYDTVSYNNEAVAVALEHADEALEEAAESNPSEKQERAIDYLETYADLIRHTSGTYDGLLTTIEHVELSESYVNADRREDAHAELDDAETSRQESASDLDSATGVLSTLQDRDVSLDADLDLLGYEQRLEAADSVIRALAHYIPGYGHWIDGAFSWSTGFSLLEGGEYVAANEAFLASWDGFANAQSEYRKAEEEADTDLRHTMIERACRARNYREAADHAATAAQLYDDGDIQSGDEEILRANEISSSNC